MRRSIDRRNEIPSLQAGLRINLVFLGPLRKFDLLPRHFLEWNTAEAAALARDHRDLTREALLDLEATPHELAAAVAQIAEPSGLVPKDGAAGERPADR